jgi:phosphoglycolate phosphatase-like HAD superfamily hydrolase
VHAVVERYALRGLVVLGDDVTDLDMFRAAADLRAAGRLRGTILAVRGGREVPAEVADAADAVIGSPEEVVSLLLTLARQLA